MLRNAVLRSAPASWRSGSKRFEDFRRSGDVAAFARRYTDFFRAFTEPVLRAAFAAPRGGDAIDDIYARAERLIRDDPERCDFRYVSVAAVLTRR